MARRGLKTEKKRWALVYYIEGQKVPLTGNHVFSTRDEAEHVAAKSPQGPKGEKAVPCWVENLDNNNQQPV